MNNNMKKVGWVVLSCALIGSVSACSKKESDCEIKRIPMSIVASKPDFNTRALAVDGMNLSGEWRVGDQIKAITEPSIPTPGVAWQEIGVLTAQGNGKTTTFSGTLTTNPEFIILSYPNYPMDYRGQKGTLEDVAAHYDYSAAIIDQWAMDNQVITVPNGVEFTSRSQSIIRFTLKDSQGNLLPVTSLTVSISPESKNFVQYFDLISAEANIEGSSIQGPITITPDSPMSELWASLAFAVKDNIDLNLTATCENGDVYTYSKSNVSFNVGQFYSITVKMIHLVNLASLSSNYEAKDKDVLTGTLSGNYKISVQDGASITLRDVTINAAGNKDPMWAGITCNGDATITLEGTNSVTGFSAYFPGILAANGKTLTIQGTGSLTAKNSDHNNGLAPGIGGAGGSINNVTPEACGNINILGGSITAVGGYCAPGIGAGTVSRQSGWINIANTVTRVSSTRGKDDGINPVYSIGFGWPGTCERVTIGGVEYWDGTAFKNGGETYLRQETLVYQP